MFKHIMLIACLLSVSGITFAFDQENIQVHGFVAQGYLKSTHNDYAAGNTTDGSFEFNEIGLNFAVPVTDELRFGIQFFSRDLMSYGNNELEVDWAFLDYSFFDGLGVRAGKIKAPLGLYNRQRELDMLRVAVFLPSCIYSQSMRQYLVAIHGIGLYGSVALGSIGELDYEIIGGTMPTSNSGISYSLEYEYSTAGALFWNTPIPGLRLALTGANTKGNMHMDTEYGGRAYVLEADLELESLSAASLEYEYGNLKFCAETSRAIMTVESQYYNTDYDSLGWYVSASWLINHWLGIGVYYSNDDDKNFDSSSDAPHYASYQKDLTFSLRFNVTTAWFIKIETHVISGISQLTSLYTEETGPEPEKDWNLSVVKTGISF